MSALSCRGLVHDYAAGTEHGGALRALAGVDFEAREGELVAVIGPNGSGKSTLIKCLAGLLEPTAGEVHLSGERLQLLEDHAAFAQDLRNANPSLQLPKDPRDPRSPRG